MDPDRCNTMGTFGQPPAYIGVFVTGVRFWF